MTIVNQVKSASQAKPLLTLLVAALLGVTAGACGSTSPNTGSSPSTSSAPSGSDATTPVSSTTSKPDYTKVDSDKDNDIGEPHDDRNNNSLLNIGHAASPQDAQAVVALIKAYYAAALAGNGAKACLLLYSTFAEAVPEDYGQTPGPDYMRGATSCQAALTRLFKHFHNQLVVEVPKLKVTHVRLIEHRGFALLSFGMLPERQIPVAREGQAWKVAALLDSELP